MTPFLVSAPASMAAKKEWRHVVLRATSTEEAAESVQGWKSTATIRRIEVPWDPSIEKLLHRLDFPVQVLVEVGNEGTSDLGGVSRRRWEEKGVNLWARPHGSLVSDRKALEAAARSATKAGWPFMLRIEEGFLTETAALLPLLDYYLFHEELSVPINPYHGMLTAKLQRSERTMWSFAFGSPEDHFFVGTNGLVSLCRSWTEQEDLVYGESSKPMSSWHRSLGYQALGAHMRSREPVFFACRTCRHHPFCRGMMLRLTKEADCTTWVEIFERLRMVSATLSRIPRETGNPKELEGRKGRAGLGSRGERRGRKDRRGNKSRCRRR